MKFEIIYKINSIAARRPTESQVKALIEEGILSKSLVRNIDFELYQFHGDDWVSPALPPDRYAGGFHKDKYFDETGNPGYIR